MQKAREEEDEDEDLDMDMTERWSHVERDQPFREDGKEVGTTCFLLTFSSPPYHLIQKHTTWHHTDQAQ